MSLSIVSQLTPERKRKRKTLFENLSFYILPKCLFSGPMSTLTQAIERSGGTIHSSITLSTTHILTNTDFTATREALSSKLGDSKAEIYDVSFVSESLVSGELAGTPISIHDHPIAPLVDPLVLHRGIQLQSREPEGAWVPLLIPKSSDNQSSLGTLSSYTHPVSYSEPLADPGVDRDTSDEETLDLNEAASISGGHLPSNTQLNAQNRNKHITDLLQKVSDKYKLTNDRFHVKAYEVAITAIKRLPPITTHAQVDNTKFEGFGPRMRKKVKEILSSGTLAQANIVEDYEQYVSLFSNILNVGPIIGLKFYNSGYRTLQDLLDNVNLSKDQLVGIQYFDDLRSKMNRDEVAEIASLVRSAANKIDLSGSLTFDTTGSYRRGESACGDCDVVISYPPDFDHRADLLEKVVEVLQSDPDFKGFIIHSLKRHHTTHNNSKESGENPFVRIQMFVVKLPKAGSKARRLDILTVSSQYMGASMIYFTGNTEFNKRIRRAAEAKGMKLTNHALLKIESDGSDRVIASYCEEDVFEAIGLPWREPTDRNL